MKYSEFIARTREKYDGKQALIDHLKETAALARTHAASWGGDFAYVCGLAHDVGKYSQAFQERIRGKKIRVDHATAGGKLLYELNPTILGLMAAYCVMGHHGGMPNGGFKGTSAEDDATLFGRIERRVEDYSSYKSCVRTESCCCER